MRTGHLFAGGGGGIYVDLILGHAPIFAVEWDAYACAVLRSRAADGWFPGLSVYDGDVRLWDPSEYAGKVDCIHAGFPCTDISTAGRGAGINGERSGLYREVLRCANVIRPRYLFLENSPAIVSRGLGQVLGDLANRGYDARWTVLAAAEVGAPHQRDRWWCLAENPDAQGVGRKGELSAGCDGQGGKSRLLSEPGGVCRQVPDSKRNGLQGSQHSECWEGAESLGRRSTNSNFPNVANAGFGRFGRARSGEMEQQGRTETIRSGEALADANTSGRDRRPGELGQGGRGQSANSGWWATEPDVGRLVNGLAFRGHQIKCLGNGQVPLVAAAAWKILGGPTRIPGGSA